jgi:[protein-PII] uridylyltransferase
VLAYSEEISLRTERERLLADYSLTGTRWCQAYARSADHWLADIFSKATGADSSGLALLAVGGYGRGELAPGSDLDLLLVYERRGNVGAIAQAIWYPIWDEGIHLDHSVRTYKEVGAAMDSDIKVALGLVEARLVAGDAKLAEKVMAKVHDLWGARLSRWLPVIHESASDRHLSFGETSFILEPDLKEARGGLRDLHILRATAAVAPVLASLSSDPELSVAGETLTAARVELQRQSGKPTNKLLLADQESVSVALGYQSSDDLMAAIASSARSISWTSDDSWRRLEMWLDKPRRRPGQPQPLEPGLVVHDGEIALAAPVSVAADPSLAFRAAAASAELDLPLSRTMLERIARELPRPAEPWPAAMLGALLRLLDSGPGLVTAIETLDHFEIWPRLLPEWETVRHRPQRNAYHRFTVDRHLVETAVQASHLVRRVARPDLLLLAALVHDIGKGHSGDHVRAGAVVVGSLGHRIGLESPDVDMLVKLVRLHLLLADSATRRDLDDPMTVTTVAAAVGDRTTLELLAALTEADGLATGPSAWGTWKAARVATLVERVEQTLDGTRAEPRPPQPTPAQLALLAAHRTDLLAEGGHLTVVAPDYLGLLATVAGVLALSGVTVRSASTLSDFTEAMALLEFEVAPTFDVLPDWNKVRQSLEDALGGRLPLDDRLAERESQYARHRRPISAAPPVVQVSTHNAESDLATVIEVRAPDTGPVLYRIARAISAAGVDIVCALVNTIGAEAIDVFYVRTGDGARLESASERRLLEAAIVEALS